MVLLLGSLFIRRTFCGKSEIKLTLAKERSPAYTKRIIIDNKEGTYHYWHTSRVGVTNVKQGFSMPP